MSERPLFPLGRILITPAAEEYLSGEEVSTALRRHQHGDHGDIPAEDMYQNRRGLVNCGMVMSVFIAAEGGHYWVQTHGTRSHTIILLPGE